MRLNKRLHKIIKDRIARGMQLQFALDELVESAMKQRRWIVDEATPDETSVDCNTMIGSGVASVRSKRVR